MWSGQQCMVTDTGGRSLGGEIAHDCFQACCTNSREVRELLDSVKEAGCDEDGRQVLSLGKSSGRHRQLREVLVDPRSSRPQALNSPRPAWMDKLQLRGSRRGMCEADQANRDCVTRAAQIASMQLVRHSVWPLHRHRRLFRWHCPLSRRYDCFRNGITIRSNCSA